MVFGVGAGVLSWIAGGALGCCVGGSLAAMLKCCAIGCWGNWTVMVNLGSWLGLVGVGGAVVGDGLVHSVVGCVVLSGGGACVASLGLGVVFAGSGGEAGAVCGMELGIGGFLALSGVRVLAGASRLSAFICGVCCIRVLRVRVCSRKGLIGDGSCDVGAGGGRMLWCACHARRWRLYVRMSW